MPGAGAAGVSNAEMIKRLSNNGAISGGNGGGRLRLRGRCGRRRRVECRDDHDPVQQRRHQRRKRQLRRPGGRRGRRGRVELNGSQHRLRLHNSTGATIIGGSGGSGEYRSSGSGAAAVSNAWGATIGALNNAAGGMIIGGLRCHRRCSSTGARHGRRGRVKCGGTLDAEQQRSDRGRRWRVRLLRHGCRGGRGRVRT